MWSFGTFDFAEFKRRVILSTSKVQLNGGAFITYIFFCLYPKTASFQYGKKYSIKEYSREEEIGEHVAENHNNT